MGRSLGGYRADTAHPCRAQGRYRSGHNAAPQRAQPRATGVVLVLVFFAIALTLAIIEVLFRVARGADKEDRAAALNLAERFVWPRASVKPTPKHRPLGYPQAHIQRHRRPDRLIGEMGHGRLEC
jgi:hypothetical protein